MHAAGWVLVVLVVHRFVECVDTLAELGGEVMHSTNHRPVEMRLPQLHLDIPRCHRYALHNSLVSGRPGFIPVCTDIQNFAAPGLLHATPGFAIHKCGRRCQNVATALPRVPASQDATPEPAGP